MSTYTSGPWNIEREELGDEFSDEEQEHAFPERIGPIVAWEHESQDYERIEADAALISAAPDLIEVVAEALSLKGGWREAITELEDFCSEPVRLKNMIAAADQIDNWARKARAAFLKASLAPVPQ